MLDIEDRRNLIIIFVPIEFKSTMGGSNSLPSNYGKDMFEKIQRSMIPAPPPFVPNPHFFSLPKRISDNDVKKYVDSLFDQIDITSPELIDELYTIQQRLVQYLQQNRKNLNFETALRTINSKFDDVEDDYQVYANFYKVIQALREKVGNKKFKIPPELDSKMIEQLQNLRFISNKNKANLIYNVENKVWDVLYSNPRRTFKDVVKKIDELV